MTAADYLYHTLTLVILISIIIIRRCDAGNKTMIVCLCLGVSDRVVRLVVANGATSVDAVAARCGAGTDCGSCRHAIQDLLDDAGASAAPRACRHIDSGASVSSSSVAAGA
jgi:bacterioferritin-associated ferredoxin